MERQTILPIFLGAYIYARGYVKVVGVRVDHEV